MINYFICIIFLHFRTEKYANLFFCCSYYVSFICTHVCRKKILFTELLFVRHCIKYQSNIKYIIYVINFLFILLYYFNKKYVPFADESSSKPAHKNNCEITKVFLLSNIIPLCLFCSYIKTLSFSS